MSDGLVVALVLDGAGGARPVDWQGVRSWVPDQGVLWVHLDRSEPDAARWLVDEAGLESLVSDALLADETRPRASVQDGGVIAVLRGVNFEAGAEPEDMISLRFWIEPRRLVTTRSRPLRSTRDLVRAFERGRGPRTVGQLVAGLADRLVERAQQVIDEVDDQVAEFEEELLGEPGSDLRERIAALRRRVITLRRYLGPQREALARLATLDLDWLSQDDRAQLRESQDALMRYVETLEAVRERAVVAQDQLASQLADQLNSRMYVLSLVAAVFLPLGFLTGLLGINVGGIPGADDGRAFTVFVAGLCVLVGLQVWWLRRRHWL
ncbi:MAG: zinc transporter ZntB [Myxococcota bacterium]